MINDIFFTSLIRPETVSVHRYAYDRNTIRKCYLQQQYRSKSFTKKETYLLSPLSWTFSSVQEFSGHFKTLPTTFLQSGGALGVASHSELVSTNTPGTVLNCPGPFLTGRFNNGQNGTRLKQLMLISKMWLKSVNVWIRCEVFCFFFCLICRKIVGIVAGWCRAPPFAGAEEALSDKLFAVECRALQQDESSFIKCRVLCHVSGLFNPNGSHGLSANFN